MKRSGMALLFDLLVCIFLVSVLLSIYAAAHFRLAMIEAQVRAMTDERNEIVNKISRKKLLGEDSTLFLLKRCYFLDEGKTIYIYEVEKYGIEFSYLAEERVSVVDERDNCD